VAARRVRQGRPACLPAGLPASERAIVAHCITGAQRPGNDDRALRNNTVSVADGHRHHLGDDRKHTVPYSTVAEF
jgi:hypothetical protein